jgi:hypothetical protein
MSARQKSTLPVSHDILCWAHSAPPTLMTGCLSCPSQSANINFPHTYFRFQEF